MRLCRLSVFFAVLAASLYSQGGRGTITGTVSDPTGAVVASVPIQAKNLENGAVYDATTSSTGNYTFSQLPVGTYEVVVSVPGFKKHTRSSLVVEVAAIVRVDIALEVGSAVESVTVSEAAPLLKTESGELSHNVQTTAMNSLPILGIGSSIAGSAGIRNPQAVMYLIPGA